MAPDTSVAVPSSADTLWWRQLIVCMDPIATCSVLSVVTTTCSTLKVNIKMRNSTNHAFTNDLTSSTKAPTAKTQHPQSNSFVIHIQKPASNRSKLFFPIFNDENLFFIIKNDNRHFIHAARLGGRGGRNWFRNTIEFSNADATILIQIYQTIQFSRKNSRVTIVARYRVQTLWSF